MELGNELKIKFILNRIFAAHSYEIQNGTIFKIGNSKLRLNVIS